MQGTLICLVHVSCHKTCSWSARYFRLLISFFLRLSFWKNFLSSSPMYLPREGFAFVSTGFGLWPEQWRCQVFNSVIREKLLKLLTAKFRAVVKFECKWKSMSGEYLCQYNHYSLSCCWAHDHYLIESIVIIYDYEQTLSSGKRTHQMSLVG